jgi:hypothetical protein
MKGEWEGYSDRDILISVAEKVETLFSCVNRQETKSTEIEGRVRTLEINGAQISRDTADTVKKNTLRIDALEAYVDTCKGSEEASKEQAKQESMNIGYYFAAINIMLVIATIIVMWYISH